MSSEQLKKMRAIFRAFVKSFYSQVESRMSPLLDLKWEHSQRVAKNARLMSSRMGWDSSDCYVAEAIGLLHDIGRFPQLSNYQTFTDPISVNHGEYGYKVAAEELSWKGFDDELKNLILKSIRFHNRRSLPEGLSDREMRFLKLVRDADKLDICFVFYDAVVNDKLSEHPEIGHNLDTDGAPNPEVIKDLLKGKTSRFSDLTSLADIVLLLLSWGYELNYKVACQIMRERKITANLRGLLPANPQIDMIVDQIDAHLQKSAN